jgi:DNA-binding transcriptional LysR family regulator
MDIRDLRTFVAVAELASFSRAAEQLHLAQPAVSQHVKRLERDVGAAVLRRSTRRVELTAVGEQLLRRARSILAEVAHAEEEVRLIESGGAGRVSVGFVGTATYDLLPRVARRVRQELPGITLELHGEQLSPALVEALLARRLDVVVVRDPGPDPALALRPLRSEPLVAVLPADHPAGKGDSVALADLRGSPFVTHPSGYRSVMHAAVLDACRRVGFTPVEMVEVRETATLVAFVAAGIGVALVPDPVRSLALAGVIYRSLSDVDPRTELVLATRSGEASPAVRRVADLVQAAP